MSIKEVHVCDGCGGVIESVKDRYKLQLKTDEFWEVEATEIVLNLEFCYRCALDIKNALIKIAKKARCSR